MSKTNLISIVGAGHSGSTLLDLLLGMNSEITSVGEISHWDEYLKENRLCSCGDPTLECQFWSDITRDWYAQIENNQDKEQKTNTSSYSISGVANRVRHRISLAATMLLPMHKYSSLLYKLNPLAYKRAKNIARLYDLILARSGASIVCDSSKSVFRFRLLHALRPRSSKALFLTRDGRAVAASHYRRQGRAPKASARSWRFINIYTELMLRTIDKSSYMHVRYEELCREPEKTLKKICEFLGCSFHQEMLTFSDVKPHNIGGNRMRMAGVSEIQEDLKWQTVLSSAQLIEFNRAAGKINERLLGSYLQR